RGIDDDLYLILTYLNEYLKKERMDRKQPPLIKDAARFEMTLPECQKITLDNKVPVYFVSSNEQETLQIQWVFKAGSWYETSNAIAFTANKLLKSGTIKMDASEIDETIEYYGAFLSM